MLMERGGFGVHAVAARPDLHLQWFY